jgi:hypothetical protein
MKLVVTNDLNYFEINADGFMVALDVQRPLMLEDVTFRYNFNTILSNPLIIEGTPSSQFTALSALTCWDSMMGESINGNMEIFHDAGWRKLKCHTFASTWIWIADPVSEYDGREIHREAGITSFSAKPQDYTVLSADALMLSGANNGTTLLHNNIGLQFVKNPVVANGCAYQDLLTT